MTFNLIYAPCVLCYKQQRENITCLSYINVILIYYIINVVALNLKKTTQQLVSSYYDTFLIVFISNLNSIFFYNVIKISLVLLHTILRAVCCFNVTIFQINVIM